MLNINGLSICYGPLEVVHGVTMHIEQGKIVALIGANGAGKSSILRAVSGLIRPTSGDINFLGASLVGVKPHEIAAAGIAHVMEGRQLFGGLTVEDNLTLASATHFSASAGSMEAIFQRWPILGERRDQLAGNMSGGEQQILAIARALMARPRLLMVDEPSWGLAPRIVRELMETIKQLRSEGMTILLVEQMAKMALNICDYGYVMTNGRIVLEGSAQELLSKPDMQTIYLGGEVGVKRLAEIVETPPPEVALERKELPKTEYKIDWSLREKERKGRAQAKREAVVASGGELPSQSPEPYQPKEEIFRERERLRQIRQQSFSSDKIFSSLKEEMVRIRKDVSDIKEVRVIPEGTITQTPPHVKKDWLTFEKQRHERQAAWKPEIIPEPKTKVSPPGLEATKAWRAMEAARKERQTSFKHETTSITLPSKAMNQKERERRKRQEEWNNKSSEEQETIRTPYTRTVKDFKQLETNRQERERKHRVDKNLKSTPKNIKKDQIDWKSGELQRRRKQAEMQKREK